MGGEKGSGEGSWTPRRLRLFTEVAAGADKQPEDAFDGWSRDRAAHLVQANPFLAVAVGGVRVLVPESHVDRAREIVKVIDSGGYALDEEGTDD